MASHPTSLQNELLESHLMTFFGRGGWQSKCTINAVDVKFTVFPAFLHATLTRILGRHELNGALEKEIHIWLTNLP